MTFTDRKNDGETGHDINADKSSLELPASPSPKDGKGPLAFADKANGEMPNPSPNGETVHRVNAAETAAIGLTVSPPKDGKGRPALADKAKVSVPDPSPKDDAAGHPDSAAEAVASVPAASSPKDELGHSERAEEAADPMPDPSPNDGAAGRKANATSSEMLPAASSAMIDHLAELQVRRKFYIGVVNRQTNAAKALVRRALGWRYDAEDAGREKLNARAARIVAAALAGKEQKAEDAAAFGALAFDLATIAAAIEPCTTARHEIELEMKRTARKLPVWFAWAKDVKGLGELGLAAIIAEAGDLSGYPKKGHLWKRLGLAPLDGKAFSTWRMKGGLTAEQWTDAGYSPRRRAEIYAVISEPLFRAQSVASGSYRAIYDRRREHTAETHPDWTKAHSHMDGLRIMTKYLIRDLWAAWRALHAVPIQAASLVPANLSENRREAKICHPERVGGRVPTGEPNEREAGQVPPEKAGVFVPTAHPNRRREANGRISETAEKKLPTGGGAEAIPVMPEKGQKTGASAPSSATQDQRGEL
jgi:hypothetical protein